MSNLPSTSSEACNESFRAATDRAIMILARNAERQRLEELSAERKEQGKFLRELVRERKREIRRANNHEAYDSGESGYSSATNKRRIKIRTAELLEKLRARERNIRERKERQQKEAKEKEDKRELDAMFHIMLHDSDDLVVSDPTEYEFQFPAFMRFDEIKRGFDEQMKRENALKKEREEAEKKAAAEKEAKEEPKEEPKEELKEELKEEPKEERKPAASSSSAAINYSMNYDNPFVYTDWHMGNSDFKIEQQTEDIDLRAYASSSDDEEHYSASAITERAMKWTLTNPEASTSAGTSASTSAGTSASTSAGTSASTSAGTSAGTSYGWMPNVVYTVHDSDSE